MNKKEVIVKIEEEAKKFFVGASGCHDWTHVKRVKNLALHIGKKEKADIFVLELAALLHDIGRKEEEEGRGKFCHAEKGAEMAKEILERYGIEEEQIENVVHCIETHRWRKNRQPETLEAKIIFDSDKLDSIGAIGIARDFLFSGGAGSCCLYSGNEKNLAKAGKNYTYGKEDSALLEYYIKLRFVHKKIVTKEGKKVAKERKKYMDDFFKRFENEIKGLM
ncbi:MAG: hypothetical protein ACD_15C00217G0008 [uncultured bacterium]|nr:MAG: hypothetical protein ACD_15C00217G0008 [uncultured bacterium]